MLVLGIDTATPVTSVALGDASGVLATLGVRRDRGHARLLVPAVRSLLRDTGLDTAQVGGVAVGTGPGLFSGLRVGIATAKALAQGWRCPMVGISSLDLLALPQRHVERTVCAALDARRGEVFAAFYRPVPGGMARDRGMATVGPDQLAAAIEARGERVLMVGDGALAYRSVFERLGGKVDLGGSAEAVPSVAALVELAVPRFQREEFVQPTEITPLYLRGPDADPTALQRFARPGRLPGDLAV